MQVSRCLRFQLARPKNGGGISWQNMDPSLKNIATKTRNPWSLDGTPLKALDARLKKAGLHNPWLRNRAARIPEILNLQKGYYNYFHRHVPFAVTFCIFGDIAQEMYCQMFGIHNVHHYPFFYPLPQVYKTNRFVG